MIAIKKAKLYLMAMIPPLSDLNDQPQYAGKGSQTPL